MINFDKFLASFIGEIKRYHAITSYNIPSCIRKALEDQGLEYRDGEIVKTQDVIAVESEDERIKKLLISGMKNLNYSAETFASIPIKDVIDWLEKQGNPNTEYWKGYKDGKKAILDRYSEFKEQDQQEEPQVYKIEDGKVITYSESKGYKVIEPKFKVGDWVACKGLNTVLIVNIDDDKYEVEFINGNKGFPHIEYVDRNFHLWTVQDAKDGDVLVSKYNKPFIYNGNRDSFNIGSYCGISVVDTFTVSTEKCDWTENVSIYPATKEQCDLLFQKMYEADYTFDFEKKELKKLKFRVGDEVISENEKSLTITKIDEEGYWSNDLFICGFNTEHIWDLVEQKSTWKPSDEQMNAFKQAYDWYNTHSAQNIALNSLYNDLKKLKGE